ncbi:MAG: hypothetical protein GF401_07530 [Chitinivibrionales bacterium]|nr:hypothetical protein [Chitinivibrionales bacterium]
MKIKEKAVYLDVCALGRPYDDQSFMRIEIESTAVQLIMVHVKAGLYRLYYSPVHVREISSNPDEIVKSDLLTLLYGVGKNVKSIIKPDMLEKRGRELFAAGLGVGDAFHVAHAEQARAVFITCDDRLLRKYRAIKSEIWCGTPVEFCKKEGLI